MIALSSNYSTQMHVNDSWPLNLFKEMLLIIIKQRHFLHNEVLFLFILTNVGNTLLLQRGCLLA